MLTPEQIEQRRTGIHDLEKRAMVGDRSAVLLLVSLERGYRAASEALRATRYSDGECDSYSLTTYLDAVDEAEAIALESEPC